MSKSENSYKIKQFWEKRALDNSNKINTEMGNTLDDVNLRKLEIKAILKYIRNNQKVLDVGCGNGYSTIDFASSKKILIDGVDYSKQMILNARKLLSYKRNKIKGKVNFFQRNILKDNLGEEKYDTIITERCLINLGTWDKQKEAIISLHKYLKPGGYLLMIQGFKDNLDEINKIRRKYKLKPINIVWHNLFFEKRKFEKFVKKYFQIKHIDNFGSTYMLITRTLFHALKDNHNQDIDKLATLLPNFGNYNYQRLYVLIKES
jgi:ubiquinone/menaquinone biosynthesis C-methylase UbiE